MKLFSYMKKLPNQKGLTPVIILVGVLVVVIIGAVFYFSRGSKQTQSNPTQSSSLKKQESKPTLSTAQVQYPSTQADNLQDFSDGYTESLYGDIPSSFTLKFPKGYFMYGEYAAEGNQRDSCHRFTDIKEVHPPDENTSEYAAWLKETQGAVSVEVCYVDKKTLTDAPEELYTGQTNFKISSPTLYTINGYSGYKATAIPKSDYYGDVKGEIIVLKKPNGGYVAIRAGQNSDTSKGQELFKIILSSFRFTK